MTPGELKFALLLEARLNSLPDPEYRQLVVEALMIFSLVTKSSDFPSFGNTPLLVENVINAAQQLFLDDQVCDHWGSGIGGVARGGSGRVTGGMGSEWVGLLEVWKGGLCGKWLEGGRVGGRVERT